MEQSDPFPQDLAVIGFDNTAAAKLITPWLITVRQPMAGGQGTHGQQGISERQIVLTHWSEGGH